MSSPRPPRKPYPSDLSDERWKLIEDLIPQPPVGGPQEHLYGGACLYERRDIVDAILYVTRAGCPWRYLPHDFPPWDTVYSYFQIWSRNGTWERLHDVLRRRVRTQAGRTSSATAGSVDSQSVKSTATGGAHGFDAGKKIKGRKRHLFTDTMGLLIALHLTSASVQDRDAVQPLFEQATMCDPDLQKVWLDQAYRGPRVAKVASKYGLEAEISSHRIHDSLSPKSGFVAVPKRWVSERSFGWINWERRLSKDHERTDLMAGSFVRTGFIGLMLRRLARENLVHWNRSSAA